MPGLCWALAAGATSTLGHKTEAQRVQAAGPEHTDSSLDAGCPSCWDLHRVSDCRAVVWRCPLGSRDENLNPKVTREWGVEAGPGGGPKGQMRP